MPADARTRWEPSAAADNLHTVDLRTAAAAAAAHIFPVDQSLPEQPVSLGPCENREAKVSIEHTNSLLTLLTSRLEGSLNKNGRVFFACDILDSAKGREEECKTARLRQKQVGVRCSCPL